MVLVGPEAQQVKREAGTQVQIPASPALPPQLYAVMRGSRCHWIMYPGRRSGQLSREPGDLPSNVFATGRGEPGQVTASITVPP